jgi:6-pyruvoyltetrahydropterin/6-carboxytetrahydropterin synthase
LFGYEGKNVFELKVITRFAAAHQLKMVAKKCENLHGHNWKVEICVAGDTLNHAGVLMDFGEIKTHVSEIVSKLDHQFLNNLEDFGENRSTSSENIAAWLAAQLQKTIDAPSIRVTRVTIWESDDACATYIVPDGISSR